MKNSGSCQTGGGIRTLVCERKGRIGQANLLTLQKFPEKKENVNA